MAIITFCRILITLLLFSDNGTAYELFSIGCQLELEGNVKAAIEYYMKAKELAPDSPDRTQEMETDLWLSSAFPGRNGNVSVQDHLWRSFAVSCTTSTSDRGSYQVCCAQPNDSARYAGQLPGVAKTSAT